jgi:hypothetical protein
VVSKGRPTGLSARAAALGSVARYPLPGRNRAASAGRERASDVDDRPGITDKIGSRGHAPAHQKEAGMPEIDGGTLMMAIQALDAMIQKLAEEIDDAGEEVDPELQLLHFSCEKTAWWLEELYEELLETVSNFPPYRDLVREVDEDDGDEPAGGAGSDQAADRARPGAQKEPGKVEIDGNSLVMTIQAVDIKLRELRKEIEEAGEDVDPELELLELSYWKSARDMQQAYEQALEHACNLPPYRKLVRGNDEPGV